MLFNFQGPGTDLERERNGEKPLEPQENVWGCSSVGRAPALHAGGQEFEPPHLHQHFGWRETVVESRD